MGQCQFDDRGLQERVDDRVAIERGLVLVFGRNPPHRFVAAVHPGHRVPVGQRVDGRADTVGSAKSQGAVGDSGRGLRGRR